MEIPTVNPQVENEFVQSQTAQITAIQIVQSGIAQFQPTKIPAILCLISYTNHVEILNRCRSMEEYIFYILYAAHEHLKVEELRRSIVNQTYN